MSEIILAKVVETCRSCPSQWDAWDIDGNYWYLRYRHSRGTVERQVSPEGGLNLLPGADICNLPDYM